MNLYQANTNKSEQTIGHASWELQQFSYFLKKAKEAIDKQTLHFKVESIPCEDEDAAQKGFCYRIILDGLNDQSIEIIEKTLFEGSEPRLYDRPYSEKDRKPVKLLNRHEEERTLTFAKELEGLRLFLQPNDYQIRRQLDAIRELKDSPKPWHADLISLFAHRNTVFRPITTKEWVNEGDWKVLTDLQRDGTQEQRDFVEKALNTPDFAVLEGPPGSGKTTAIIELVIQLAMRGKRVLLCSATHVAIDNVIGRILGRYSHACKPYIVPVRIASNEGDIREEEVKPYRLEKLVQTKKLAIKDFLNKQRPASGSQEYLKANIDTSEENQIQRLILESANLVGGTTIGILQHPDIRYSKSYMEPFDYLIIDEASKVPFQEFMVPALHAKRWILVGDIHQLSPYVEDSYVSHSLATMVPETSQPMLVRVAKLREKLRRKYTSKPVVAFFPDSPGSYLPFFEKDKETIAVALDENWRPSPSNLLELQATDIILCPEKPQFRKWMAELVYVKAEWVAEEGQKRPFSQIQNYFHRNAKDPLNPHSFHYSWDKKANWAELLAGKLNQKYGRRDDKALFTFTQQEVNDLIPDTETHDRISDLSRVVFPSILELLQRGVGVSSRQHREVETVFANGLSEESKRDRFTPLTYQHRMHPEVAKTSRTYFYSENANLKPADSVEETRPDRTWGYQPHHRVEWIDHKDNSWRKETKILHRGEVKAIREELEKFGDWALTNPVPMGWNRSSGKYEVAVLTFYRAQEAAIREQLRELTQQKRQFRNFDLGNNIQLTLCTVDQFQGQEADMVLLSFTKYTPGAHFHSPNRLNVALTRARHKLILFGNRTWMVEKAHLSALNSLGNFTSRKTY